MKTCLDYWLIEPIRVNFLDSSDAIPAFEVSIGANDQTYKLALFVDSNGLPEYTRLALPNLQSEEIPKDTLPLIQAIREHLLSVLRVTYQPEASLFPRPIWTFVEENAPHRIGLEISQLTRQLSFDPERVRRLFVGSFPHREEMRLLIDGQDPHIPLQYRYLSLYKILELHFKDKNKWREDDLERTLLQHEARFRAIGAKKKPLTHIHMLRDKCAHIKIRGKKDTFGVTHLRQTEAAEVEKLLPILRDICVEVINIRANGDFYIQRLEGLPE